MSGRRASSIAIGMIALALGGTAPGSPGAVGGESLTTGGFLAARPGALAEARRRIAEGDAALERAAELLVESAAGFLREPPPSVIDKRTVAPSGDRHDYTSLAPYYWPDPTAPGGLPYVRRDGTRNPDSDDATGSDRPRAALLGDGVQTLALAWYFTREPSYARRAAEYARVWFVADETRMNPHLRYAQAVRGTNTGRPAGILEGRHFVRAIDALSLVADSGALAPAERAAIDAWAEDYLDWLLDSDPGRAEREAANNHGTFFDLQVATLAVILGHDDLARRVLEEAGPRRIATQIEPDGRQPHELLRTRSLGYSIYNLRGLAALATVGEHVGVDLWRFTTADGRSIRRGIEFLRPFLGPAAAPWPHEQIVPIAPDDSASLLWTAAAAYDIPEIAADIADFPDAGQRVRLLFPRGFAAGAAPIGD